jgi:hypothetical protein
MLNNKDRKEQKLGNISCAHQLRMHTMQTPTTDAGYPSNGQIDRQALLALKPSHLCSLLMKSIKKNPHGRRRSFDSRPRHFLATHRVPRGRLGRTRRQPSLGHRRRTLGQVADAAGHRRRRPSDVEAARPRRCPGKLGQGRRTP